MVVSKIIGIRLYLIYITSIDKKCRDVAYSLQGLNAVDPNRHLVKIKYALSQNRCRNVPLNVSTFFVGDT